ncbi:hypothetical protein DESA109040_22115 [Deinococcus saxicola]
MLTWKPEIGVPGVVSHDALKPGQHAHLLNGRIAPASMLSVERVLSITDRVQPIQCAVDLAARFIGVQHILLHERDLELVFKAFEPTGGEVEVEHDGAARWARTTERVHHLCGAFQWHGMDHIEIRGQAVRARAVLHLTGNFCWERGLFTCVTLRADFNLGLVFRHVQPHFRQVMNLSSQQIADRHAGPGLPTATVSGDGEGPDLIRMLTHFQRLASMTALPTRRAAALLALTLREPRFVLTGRLIRGLTGDGEPGFKSR